MVVTTSTSLEASAAIITSTYSLLRQIQNSNINGYIHKRQKRALFDPLVWHSFAEFLVLGAPLSHEVRYVYCLMVMDRQFYIATPKVPDSK